MQNRFVLAGIPASIPRLPNATDNLKEFVEDHACWVDRFAFLDSNDNDDDDDDITAKDTGDSTSSTTAIAAIELHIENVRDKAIKALNGKFVSIDEDGGIVSISEEDHHSDQTKSKQPKRKCISFQIYAQPANELQSKELVQKCPLHSDDAIAEKRMEKQTLHFPLFGGIIELTVQKSEHHGGTGTFPWRGGYILSKQICHWAAQLCSTSSNLNVDAAHETSKATDRNNADEFKSLFCNKRIMELGAGSAGLPSMILGKICNTLGYEMDLIASDGIDEIVTALQVNVSDNRLDDCIRVEHIDWNDYANKTTNGEEANESSTGNVDTIMFADCIYNEECAIALSQIILHLLKPTGGAVIGVLPDFRVGLDLFEKQMKENNFVPTNISIIDKGGQKNDRFACSGGGGKDYRLIMWNSC